MTSFLRHMNVGEYMLTMSFFVSAHNSSVINKLNRTDGHDSIVAMLRRMGLICEEQGDMLLQLVRAANGRVDEGDASATATNGDTAPHSGTTDAARVTVGPPAVQEASQTPLPATA